jgi:hypothetical protein
MTPVKCVVAPGESNRTAPILFNQSGEIPGPLSWFRSRFRAHIHLPEEINWLLRTFLDWLFFRFNLTA